MPYQTSDNSHVCELDWVLSIYVKSKMTIPTRVGWLTTGKYKSQNLTKTKGYV